MKWTQKQKFVINALIKLTYPGSNIVQLDQLYRVVHGLKDDAKKRSTLASCMRDLERKLAYENVKIISSSKLGRGHKLEYHITGPLVNIDLGD